MGAISYTYKTKHTSNFDDVIIALRNQNVNHID